MLVNKSVQGLAQMSVYPKYEIKEFIFLIA